MNIAIIGAGAVGSALGGAWARHGHDIVFGVRNPAKAEVRALLEHCGATAAEPAAAAAAANVVVIALPWHAAEGAVKALGDLSGKTVIDCMNPLAMTDAGLVLERGFDTSGGEALAGWLPGAHVVKAMNQVSTEIMADTSGLPVRPVMFVAGDHEAAKATVTALVTDLGFEALDAGGLDRARILEPLAMVYINQAMFRGLGRDWAFAIARRGAPAGATA
jgi:NADPH-dependent F420 reductase